MNKMRIIAIVGLIVIITIAVVLKLNHKNTTAVIPFLLPFLVIILIDIDRKSKKK